MQEIVIEDRELSLKTFINGIPNLKLIPKEKRESVLASLELQIYEYYKSEKDKKPP